MQQTENYSHLEPREFVDKTGLDLEFVPGLRPYLKIKDSYNLWFNDIRVIDFSDSSRNVSGCFITQYKTLTRGGVVLESRASCIEAAKQSLTRLFGFDQQDCSDGIWKPDNPEKHNFEMTFFPPSMVS
jgi:hypothetical protein